MPYYRCPACGLTVHNVAGRFAANTCPTCSAPLSAADQIHIRERRPAAIMRRFPTEPEAAAAARRELDGLLWTLEEDERQVLALLVTELIANSVEHSARAPGGSIRLDVTASDWTVRVEVRDDGNGFEPTPRMADSPLDSHWGLHLVDQLADRWEVAAVPETLVWFELDRKGSSTASLVPARVAAYS